MTESNYDAVFYDDIARVEKDHFWFRHRAGVIEDVMKRFAEPGSGAKVLEIGSGTCFIAGGLSRAFPRAEIYCTDLNIQGLKIGRKKAGINAAVADIMSSPFRILFDFVCMFDVLEHVKDDRGMLRAVCSMLAPGGKLLLTVPAGPVLWSDFDVVSGHQRRYVMGELREKLAESGFSVSYANHFYSLLVPLMRLSRRKGASGKEEMAAEVRKQLNPSRALNALLHQSLRLEKAAMALGARMPFGTSLIAAAERIR